MSESEPCTGVKMDLSLTCVILLSVVLDEITLQPIQQKDCCFLQAKLPGSYWPEEINLFLVYFFKHLNLMNFFLWHDVLPQ